MVSVLRVCAVVLIVEPSVLASVAIPAIAAALAFAVCGALLLTRDSGNDEGSAITRNPFELGPLLLFALLFAIVATASAGLAAQFGGRGLLATSALAGSFDVDVSVLGALRLVKHSVSVETVSQAVLAALAANAIGRLLLAISAGPVKFWLPLAAATLIAATLGACAMLLPSP
jgi:uncharacterized membrane protein (DUF4010 family)